MNYSIIFRYLGIISILIGISMVFSLPWALPMMGGVWEEEAAGVFGLLISLNFSIALGLVFLWLGRHSKNQTLLRKESIAIVGLSWILAMFLSAIPYLISGTQRSQGVPMSLVDAIFEAQSGLSTTGASVIADVENPKVIPRTILFWRGMTHFLGGFGIMVLFVALLGHGSQGKAVMRLEKAEAPNSNPQTRVRQTALALLKIYLGLNGSLIFLLLCFHVSLFDAIFIAFSTISTGGFTPFNSSIGYFAANTTLNAGMIETILIVFMVLGGTNFTLLYWAMIGKPKRLLQNTEWLVYLGILFVAILLVFGTGLYYQDFDIYGTGETPILKFLTPDKSRSAQENIHVEENVSFTETDWDATNSENFSQENLPSLPWWTSLRMAAFTVVSIMTSTGFCIDQHELWNAVALIVFFMLMFIGGCSGSTAGGTKVIRNIVAFITFRHAIELSYRPNVVRPLKLDGNNIDRSWQNGIIVYMTFAIFALGLITTLVMLVEPNTLWVSAGHGASEKLTDLSSATLSMCNNIGVSLGVAGAKSNFGYFSELTKLIFSVAMLLGRLEFYVILVLFSPSFWRQH